MDDRAVEKGLMCGSQVGKTTVALADVYHFCDTNRVRVIYTMHKQPYMREHTEVNGVLAETTQPRARG